MLHELRFIPAFLLLMLLPACTPAREGQDDAAARTTSQYLALLGGSSDRPASSSVSSRTEVTAQSASAPLPLNGTTLDRGSPDAPLELLVFTNYACGYCRQFEEEIMPRLQEDFISKGDLLVRTAILPIRKYPMSTTEAATLFCARVQGEGDATTQHVASLHRALFALPAHTLPAILDAAGQLKLDTRKLAACLSSTPALAYANAQKDLAESLEVSLVPTLVLNGERQTGLPRYADLRGWIESRMD